MYDPTGEPATPGPTPPPAPLGYARQLDRVGPRPPAPLPAVLACLPGLTCWIVFLGIIAGGMTGLRLSGVFHALPHATELLLACWALAILTAIGSLVAYVPKKRKPWYVWINLVVNLTGLLFTIAIAILIVIALGRR